MRLLVSFGLRYGGPAQGAIIDVRRLFQRNPYRRADLRSKRGTDPEVAHDIEQTPGFDESYAKLKERILKFDADVVYLGCTGGHHRSVYLAERLGSELGVAVRHRDIHRR